MFLIPWWCVLFLTILGPLTKCHCLLWEVSPGHLISHGSERGPLGTSSHMASPFRPYPSTWAILSECRVILLIPHTEMQMAWGVMCVNSSQWGDNLWRFDMFDKYLRHKPQTYVYGLLLKFPAEIFMKILSSIFYKIRSNWVISCYFSTSSIPHRLSNLHRIWLQTGVWLKSRSSPCCGLGASDGRVQVSSSASNPRVPGGINIKIIHNGKKRKLTLSSFVYQKIIHPHNTMENIHNSLVLVITFTWNKIRQNENIERKFLLYANNKNGLI